MKLSVFDFSRKSLLINNAEVLSVKNLNQMDKNLTIDGNAYFAKFVPKPYTYSFFYAYGLLFSLFI